MAEERAPAPSAYLHGTEGPERQRLTRLNALLNAACLKEIALQGGERVLDVGSGLAQLTRGLARATGPTGRVVGIERDAVQRNEALRQAREAGEEDLVELRPGEAEQLPLRTEEWGTFDVAHTRFLLEHVRDPLSVVRQMVQAVRPGGRVILEDDDHDVWRVWPEPPGFVALWRAYMESYVRLGNDPSVGRKLVELLHQAGAQPRRNHWIFFGGCSGDPNFVTLVENAIGILEGARAVMLEQRLIEERALNEALAALRAWGQRGDAALWYAMSWAEGVRPRTPGSEA